MTSECRLGEAAPEGLTIPHRNLLPERGGPVTMTAPVTTVTYRTAGGMVASAALVALRV